MGGAIGRQANLRPTARLLALGTEAVPVLHALGVVRARLHRLVRLLRLCARAPEVGAGNFPRGIRTRLVRALELGDDLGAHLGFCGRVV